MQRKIILAIGLTLLLLPVVVSTTVIEPPNRTFVQAIEVKLGLLVPKTGKLGFFGPRLENAANLAIQELNGDSSFDGVFTFSLEVEDTRTTPEGSTAAAITLADKGVVAFIGPAGSSNTLATATVSKAKNIVQLSYSATSPAITSFNDDDLLWRTAWSDALQGVALAQIANDKGLKTAVTIAVDNAYGSGIADAFKLNFEFSNGTVLAALSYNPDGTPNYNQLVTSIQNLNPDLLLVIAYTRDGNALFNELSVQNYSKAVLGTDGIASDTVFGLEGTTFNVDRKSVVAQWLYSNNLTITAPGSEATSPTKEAFISNYKGNYSEDAGTFAAEAYDAVHALGAAIKKFNSTATANIKYALPCVSFEGASGNIKFDENGDLTGTPSYALYNISRNSAGDHFLNRNGYWVGADSGITTPSDCSTRSPMTIVSSSNLTTSLTTSLTETTVSSSNLTTNLTTSLPETTVGSSNLTTNLTTSLPETTVGSSNLTTNLTTSLSETTFNFVNFSFLFAPISLAILPVIRWKLKKW